jgi:hypothetical protein
MVHISYQMRCAKKMVSKHKDELSNLLNVNLSNESAFPEILMEFRGRFKRVDDNKTLCDESSTDASVNRTYLALKNSIVQTDKDLAMVSNTFLPITLNFTDVWCTVPVQ